MVKSACGIEAVYMCFNGTGIWGCETIWRMWSIGAYALFGANVPIETRAFW